MQRSLTNFILPPAWRANYGHRYADTAEDGGGSDFDSDDGEELFEVDENRREALSLDARRGVDEDGRRLSRELEEGFKDDSGDENDFPGDRRLSVSR